MSVCHKLVFFSKHLNGWSWFLAQRLHSTNPTLLLRWFGCLQKIPNSDFLTFSLHYILPSVLGHCWLGIRNSIQPVKTRKAALDRGQTDLISLTHDLGLLFPQAMVISWPTHMQKIKVRGRFKNLPWIQTDGWRWLHYLTCYCGNKWCADVVVCVERSATDLLMAQHK